MDEGQPAPHEFTIFRKSVLVLEKNNQPNHYDRISDDLVKEWRKLNSACGESVHNVYSSHTMGLEWNKKRDAEHPAMPEFEESSVTLTESTCFHHKA
jgi:hypothetical protein